MRKVLFILFLAIVMCCNSFSQQLVQLHAMVGDTIDNTEKVAFYLFPEINDSSFVEAVIFYRDSVFQVQIAEKGKEKYMFTADSILLQDYHNNIEKLALYYARLAEQNTEDNKNMVVSQAKVPTGPEIKLNEEDRKKLVKEARRYWRKKDKAEDLGLWGVDKENYIKAASHTNIFKGKVRF